MKITRSGLALLLGLALCSTASRAGEIEDSIIAQAIAAYGGDTLTSLRTLRIDDSYKSFREGQSTNPNEIDQVSYRTRTTIDFVRRRKSMQSIGGVRIPGLFVQHTFFNGETGYRINHYAETAAQNPRASFERVDRGLSWRLDLALIKLISEMPDAVSYEGEGLHRGKRQHILSLQAEGYPEFTFYIDQTLGLLTKMTRPDGADGNLYTYVYSDHQSHDGVTYAADTYVMRGGRPESLTVSRSVVVNGAIDSAYQVPTSYGAPAQMAGFPDMQVQTLADGVFHVGRGGGFSIFIDAGDFFIASGGYPGLADRYEAVKKHIGTDKPLGYQIVTHHHEDHIAGLRDAAALGAQFIVAEDHKDVVRAVLGADIDDARFIAPGKTDDLAGDLVEVLDIATWHANHNLITYVRHARMVFSADHFFTFKAAGAPDPAQMYAEFKDAVDGHDLEVEILAAAHSGRLLRYQDLVQSSTPPFKPLACPGSWDFCR